jgi:hypothetical protein
MENNQKLTDFLQSIGHAVELLRVELSSVSALRAEMETIKAEQQKLSEALLNQGESMRQFADIAFDENKFTQALLDKVDDTAREAARDAIDVDDIADEAARQIDVEETVARHVERYGFVGRDDVNDAIQDYITENSILDANEVEDAIEEYLTGNDYITREDVESLVEDAVKQALENAEERIMNSILYVIANKLMGKETHHANNNRDHSVQVSGTNGQGEARSYNALGA